jgi:hypothetical protein
MAALPAACLALGLSLATDARAQGASTAPEIATYSVETVVSVSSDRRTRGISDSLRKPSAVVAVTLAHESGFVGLLQLNTVSKRQFTEGSGLGVTMAGGYRWGDSEGMRYGVGLAREFFPGAKLPVAPTAVDPLTLEFSGFTQGNFNSSFLVLEAGWKYLEARYLHVLSRDYRGINTASVCGTLVQQVDPTEGVLCYLRGNAHSRGAQLLDIDFKYPINGQTKLLLHWGIQRVPNFKETNFQDWRFGVSRTQWGLELTGEVMGTTTRSKPLFQAIDGDGRVRQLDNNTLVLTIAKKF